MHGNEKKNGMGRRERASFASLDPPLSQKLYIMFIFIHKSLFRSLGFVEEEIITQTFVLISTEFHYNSWIDLLSRSFVLFIVQVGQEMIVQWR